MNPPTESYQIELAPDLSQVSPTVDRLLAWAAILGWPAATAETWRLSLTEGIVNAINHGCTGRPEARIRVRGQPAPDGIEFQIGDPGHFVPGPAWSELPEDPLCENGRGGFLIAQSTGEWRHENDEDGHRLILRWRVAPAQPDELLGAGQAAQMIDSLTAELANTYEVVSGYAHLVGLLATAKDFTDLLLGVRARLAEVVPHAHFILRFIDDGRLVRAPGLAEEIFPEVIPLNASALEARVATTGRFLTVNATLHLAQNDPLAPAQTALVVLPVSFATNILGTLVVTSPADESLFTAGQIELLQSVADFIGIAHTTDKLYRNREEQLRLQQDIAIAAGIQRLLLPQSMPVLPEWRVSGSCRPAREIGGDYFDFFVRPDQSCLAVVADVMGKGVPAALVATMLRTALRAHAADNLAPGEVLTRLNHQLYPDLAALEVFITVVIILLPARGRVLQYANAGHCPPLLLPTAAGTELGGGDMPLGIMPAAKFGNHAAEIPAGGALLAYTDGCYEWRRDGGSFLGTDRFTENLARHVAQRTPDLVDAVLDDITSQVGPAGLPDDCTLISIHHQD